MHALAIVQYINSKLDKNAHLVYYNSDYIVIGITITMNKSRRNVMIIHIHQFGDNIGIELWNGIILENFPKVPFYK